jgi:hypothetical protein
MRTNSQFPLLHPEGNHGGWMGNCIANMTYLRLWVMMALVNGTRMATDNAAATNPHTWMRAVDACGASGTNYIVIMIDLHAYALIVLVSGINMANDIVIMTDPHGYAMMVPVNGTNITVCIVTMIYQLSFTTTATVCGIDMMDYIVPIIYPL